MCSITSATGRRERSSRRQQLSVPRLAKTSSRTSGRRADRGPTSDAAHRTSTVSGDAGRSDSEPLELGRRTACTAGEAASARIAISNEVLVRTRGSPPAGAARSPEPAEPPTAPRGCGAAARARPGATDPPRVDAVHGGRGHRAERTSSLRDEVKPRSLSARGRGFVVPRVVRLSLGGVRDRSGLDARLLAVLERGEPLEPARQVPVPVAEQLHRRRAGARRG